MTSDTAARLGDLLAVERDDYIVLMGKHVGGDVTVADLKALLSELATARQDFETYRWKSRGQVQGLEEQLVVVRRQLEERTKALREIVELPRAVLWKAYDVARAGLDAGQDEEFHQRIGCWCEPRSEQ